MQALLSEEASTQLANHLAEIIEEKVNELMKQKQKRYLSQSEVFKEYDANARDIERWLLLGLPRRRQGVKWMYDRKDLEQIFELEKETI